MIDICISVCISVCISIGIGVCISVGVCIGIGVCISICVGVCICIVMAGGIGENAADLREQIVKRLGALGVKLDKKANKAIFGGKTGVISTADSKIPVVVIPTNEELMIARETVQVLSK